MRLAHRLSDRRSPKPLEISVLCVRENGGTAGFATCAVAPVGFRDATDVSAPTPTPVITLGCLSDRTQSQPASRLCLQSVGRPSSPTVLTRFFGLLAMTNMRGAPFNASPSLERSARSAG